MEFQELVPISSLNMNFHMIVVVTISEVSLHAVCRNLLESSMHILKPVEWSWTAAQHQITFVSLISTATPTGTCIIRT